jgi:hypothetical protein
LLHRKVANTIVDQGGDYLGPIKGNEAQVKNAVDEWIEANISPQADLIEDNKAHGCIKCREPWIVNASELEGYIHQEFGWKKM